MDLDPWSDRSELDDAAVVLNLTPLVDVVFSLLVVFMISSAAMMEQGQADAAGGKIDLSLPSGAAASAEPLRGEVVIAVDADGGLFQDGRPTDVRALALDLVERLGKQPELQVRIEADRRLTYERVMDVIDELRKMGVRNVGLATRSDGAPKAPGPPTTGAAPPPQAP